MKQIFLHFPDDFKEKDFAVRNAQEMGFEYKGRTDGSLSLNAKKIRRIQEII